MSRYNTGNPVPSNQMKDLSDNAQIIDELVHKQEDTTLDRFGNPLKTWFGIEQDAKEAMAAFGYITMDSFQDGATLTLPNQILRWKLPDGDGEYYRWDGVFPKVVPAASTPESTGGIGAGKWLSVGDAILRGDLSLPSGAEHIGISPSGTLDDVINDITPEQFGAVGDGVTDDTAALKAMFKYINDMPISFTDTAAELNPHLDVAAKRVVLRGLYMHTETIFIPSGVQIFQPGYSYFRRNVQQGFYFNPPSGEGSMAAVSTYIYLKSGSTWYLNSDPMFLMDGAQIDTGDVRTGARHIDLVNFSIITKPGTLLGLRWLGAAGCTTRNLSIGENTSVNINTARLPKVAFLQIAAWGSYHMTPKILYKTQGMVFYNGGAGVTVESAYISRLGTDGGYQETAIYSPPDFNGVGSIAVTQYNSSSTQFNYCITEASAYNFVHQGNDAANGGLNVNRCHMESFNGLTKHCYYIINADADIKLSETFIHDSSESSSIFYIKNCTKNRSTINIEGYTMFNGHKLLIGENSGEVVNLTFPNGGQTRYGKLGDWSIVNSVTFAGDSLSVSPVEIQVDPVNGNDANYGIHGEKPLKTLYWVSKISRLFKSSKCYIGTGTVALSTPVELPQVSFSGPGIIEVTSSGSLEIRRGGSTSFNNGGVISPTGYNLIKVTTNKPYSVVSTCKMTTGTSSNIFLFSANGNIDWTHRAGGELACRRYADTTSTSYSCVIGLNIRSTARPSIDSTPVSGNIITKYLSILNS